MPLCLRLFPKFCFRFNNDIFPPLWFTNVKLPTKHFLARFFLGPARHFYCILCRWIEHRQFANFNTTNTSSLKIWTLRMVNQPTPLLSSWNPQNYWIPIVSFPLHSPRVQPIIFPSCSLSGRLPPTRERFVTFACNIPASPLRRNIIVPLRCFCPDHIFLPFQLCAKKSSG